MSWTGAPSATHGDFAWPAIPGHLGPRFLSLIGTYYRIKDRFQ